MYLLGFDIGSSSVKAALLDAESHILIAAVHSPEVEMPIYAEQAGWAEQSPDLWWEHMCKACHKLVAAQPEKMRQVAAIGLSYQMHGLVLADKNNRPVRPAIIWCDSRAIEIGHQALAGLGPGILPHLLNSPGNFTASKLRWVLEHAPADVEKAAWCLLPGDYIALKMTGESSTTVSGLSEGIMWDFQAGSLSHELLAYYQIDPRLIPPVVPTCSLQGKLRPEAAAELGLRSGIPVTYRAGDQPNNALSLNVLKPGEIAATGGTSGVVYGVVDHLLHDSLGRINSFAHVNHQQDQPRIGVLLCINGAGSQYSWIRQQIALQDMSYGQMEQMAAATPIGAEGLMILPFGNGAERMLGNLSPGGHMSPIQFHRHSRAHMFRAALEGIANSFAYGIDLLGNLGLHIGVMRVGNDNLFQSAVFSQALSNLSDSEIQVIETTGAAGAAQAAGVAAGIYASLGEAVEKQRLVQTYSPDKNQTAHREAFERWHTYLESQLALPINAISEP